MRRRVKLLRKNAEGLMNHYFSHVMSVGADNMQKIQP